ncbi:phage replication initiation protein [Gemmiger formicilis]|uniref:phage replication initiation protein n=1 Tax=Gemmiger formicilis TaxID=745368 RepID=UPI0039F4666D
MANRRMFSLSIVDTDRFLEMPSSTQALYFHLGMRADDDGFVAAPKSIAAICGCSVDDIRLLAMKGFVQAFETGVLVITDWKENNKIRKDRYTPTKFTHEKMLLDGNQNGNQSDTQTATEWLPQDRLGKDRIGKVRESKADNAALPPSPADSEKVKPKRKRQEQAQETIADIFRTFAGSDTELEKALTDFNALRAANKKPLTPRAAELICKKVTSLAKEAGVRNTHGYMIAILEQSIERGWDGVWSYKGDFKDTSAVHGSDTADHPREIGPGDDITQYL